MHTSEPWHMHCAPARQPGCVSITSLPCPLLTFGLSAVVHTAPAAVHGVLDYLMMTNLTCEVLLDQHGELHLILSRFWTGCCFIRYMV